MRLTLKKKTDKKINARLKKKVRIRKKITGTTERPRLCVFRSARHIYAQIIDDTLGKTVVSASTLSEEVTKAANKDAAFKIGQTIAQLALKNNIESVVFDRNGLLYHGRVKSLADGARDAGLKF